MIAMTDLYSTLVYDLDQIRWGRELSRVALCQFKFFFSFGNLVDGKGWTFDGQAIGTA